MVIFRLLESSAASLTVLFMTCQIHLNRETCKCTTRICKQLKIDSNLNIISQIFIFLFPKTILIWTLYFVLFKFIHLNVNLFLDSDIIGTFYSWYQT